MIFSLFWEEAFIRRGAFIRGGVYFQIRDFRGAFIRGGVYSWRGRSTLKLLSNDGSLTNKKVDRINRAGLFL